MRVIDQEERLFFEGQAQEILDKVKDCKNSLFITVVLYEEPLEELLKREGYEYEKSDFIYYGCSLGTEFRIKTKNSI